MQGNLKKKHFDKNTGHLIAQKHLQRAFSMQGAIMVSLLEETAAGDELDGGTAGTNSAGPERAAAGEAASPHSTEVPAWPLSLQGAMSGRSRGMAGLWDGAARADNKQKQLSVLNTKGDVAGVHEKSTCGKFRKCLI